MTQKPLQIHEADAYIKHPLTDAANTPPASGFTFRPLQPLIVGIMVGCIALSITQLLHQIAPNWNSTYFLITPVVAAFAGHTTYYIARRRYRSGSDRLRLQIIELVFIFILLKTATYLDNTLPEIWENIRQWPDDIFKLFDLETLAAFAIACAAWFSAARTARDLEAVADPLLYKGETGPTERLSQRFLAGGMALLFFSGLARVEISTLLQPNRPAVRGLALNVLIYFVLGLIVLGQVQFTRLNRLWELQKYKVAGALNKTWLRYSLLFLLAALVIAFILPTQYTVGLLDIVGVIISAIVRFVLLVFTLISTLVSLLLSFLFNTPVKTETLPAAIPTPVPVDIPPQTPGAAIPWLALLRAAVFWIIALGVIFYVVYSYLKERPELLRTLKTFKVTRITQQWWRAIQNWWRGLRRTLRTKLPALSMNFLRRKAPHQDTRPARRRREALREQMFYDYLDTLDHARAEGFPRRDAQTPYEYHRALDPNLPDAHAELTALTEAFVEARYSAHPVEEDDVARLRANARSVRAVLDRVHAVNYQSSAISQQSAASDDQSSVKTER
jgi:hypothetical protein